MTAIETIAARLRQSNNAEAADLIEAQAREIERLRCLVRFYRIEAAENDPIGYPAYILEPPQ